MGHGAIKRPDDRRLHRKPVLQRILERVEIVPGPLDSPCWVWTGGTDKGGYGVIGDGSTRDASRHQVRIHRVMYEATVGPIPEGLEPDHLCFVRNCCSPEHIEPVTRRENQHRSRSFSGLNAAKTHCPKDHPYDAANTRIDGRGARLCRTCIAERTQRKALAC